MRAWFGIERKWSINREQDKLDINSKDRKRGKRNKKDKTDGKKNRLGIYESKKEKRNEWWKGWMK